MDSAEELRRAFDLSFASEPAPPAANLVDFLIVDGLRAIRIAEISGVAPVGRLCRLSPGIGLAAIRGKLVPVLLPDDPQSARWAAISRAAPAVALAFRRPEGFVRVPASEAVAGHVRVDGTLIRVFSDWRVER